MALGVVETRGYTAAIEAADAMCKDAQIEVKEVKVPGGGHRTFLVLLAIDFYFQRRHWFQAMSQIDKVTFQSDLLTYRTMIQHIGNDIRQIFLGHQFFLIPLSLIHISPSSPGCIGIRRKTSNGLPRGKR